MIIKRYYYIKALLPEYEIEDRLNKHYWKCNFPDVRRLVGWLVCQSVGLSVIIFPKGREVTLSQTHTHLFIS